MMFVRLLLLALIAVPFVEIGLFVLVGEALGLLPTLLGVVATGLAGALVLRWQGVSRLARLQQTLARGELPARQLADAMLVGLGGLLLLLPGYFTDAIGLALLLPPVRGALYGLLARRFVLVGAGGESRATPGLIELDEGEWRDR